MAGFCAAENSGSNVSDTASVLSAFLVHDWRRSGHPGPR